MPDLAMSLGQNLIACRDSIVEVPLLLPGWQAARLEQAAAEQGLTTGQLARRLIRDFLHQPGTEGPVSPTRSRGPSLTDAP